MILNLNNLPQVAPVPIMPAQDARRFLILLILSTVATTPTEAKEGWILRQRSGHYGGGQEISIAPDAVKWVNPRTGVSTVATAPTWTVCSFNPRLKVRYDCAPENFQGFTNYTVAMFTGQVFGDMPMSKLGSATLLGHKVEQYGFDRKSDTPIRKKWDIKKARLYGIRDRSVDPHVIMLLQRIWGGPQVDVIPVAFRYETVKSKRFEALTTSSIRRANFEPKVFSVPAGLRSVEQEQFVIRDIDEQEGFHSFLDSSIFREKK